jgi:tRNA-Thr(GGU) m(6)t(6)A37 methyltransferase TsaA
VLPAVTFQPIGIVRTPWETPEGMPIQPVGAGQAWGRAEILDSLAPGLRDLEGFERVILVYELHDPQGRGEPRLEVVPFLDQVPRGIFATRAPCRPNPIGISIVELCKVEGNVLHLRGVDLLDGTPLLDVKPYVPRFDSFPNSRAGWFEKRQDRATTMRADGRFRSPE